MTSTARTVLTRAAVVAGRSVYARWADAILPELEAALGEAST